MDGKGVYWRCACGATAELPAKNIQTSVRALRQHMTIRGCGHTRSWHRLNKRHFVLVSHDNENSSVVGAAYRSQGGWYAHVFCDIDNRVTIPTYEKLRDAQAAVEALADRVVRILV